MLTKLFSKSSYLANFLAFVFLIIVMISKIKQNYSSKGIDLSLYEHLGFICLFTFIFLQFSRQENENTKIIERSGFHIFLFPVAVAFLPKEIFNFYWIFSGFLMFHALIKGNLFIKTLKENQLFECGIYMSFSIMFIPESFIYLLVLLLRIFTTGNFSTVRGIILLFPTVITWFLILTTNMVLKINLPFYQWVNQKADFYFQIIHGLEGLAFIAIIILTLTGFVLRSKKTDHVYSLENKITPFYKLILLSIHLCFINFVRTPESLIILIPTIVYGTRNLIRIIRLRVLKESFLWIMLVFSLLNIYLSF